MHTGFASTQFLSDCRRTSISGTYLDTHIPVTEFRTSSCYGSYSSIPNMVAAATFPKGHNCFIPYSHYAQGHSLLVCWWEPSQDNTDAWEVYKQAPGFRSLGASSTTSAGWSAPTLATHPPLQLKYLCIVSHWLSSINLLGTQDWPLDLHNESHDSPRLPMTILIPANLASACTAEAPPEDELDGIEKQWWNSLR